MTWTEGLQNWDAVASTANQKATFYVKLKYLRSGAQTNIKRTRQGKMMQPRASAEYDYSDWYRGDVFKIEEAVEEKVKKLHVKR